MLQDKNVQELLKLYSEILDQLRQRRIVRSSNNPIGDYAETLFCKAMEWSPQPNSNKGVDAICKQGKRYQIKSRRVTRQNSSRQLSAIRGLNEQNFDYLAGVIFNEDFSILRACLLPYEHVLKFSDYVQHTNSWRFILRDTVGSQPGVVDVTETLKKTAAMI